VPQDYAAAAIWYRKAAEQGDVLAQRFLGIMYGKGRGVPKDAEAAAIWYRKAAEQDDEKAQVMLGQMYYLGQGVPQSYADALRWLRKAADQGAAIAQDWLGAMYREGKGVQQSYAEALKWYRKAAEQGDVGAQNDLGFMYSRGQGVPQDYVIAHMWYTLAAAQGTLKEAVTGRDWVAARMTPAQVAEAQKLVREWNVSPHDWNSQSPVGQPRDLALSAPDQPLTMKFEIDCANDDQVRKTICKLSSAILNKDCSFMMGSIVKLTCDSVVASVVKGEKSREDRAQSRVTTLQPCNVPVVCGFDEYYQLMYICGADWVPIVAKECARRSATLTTEHKKNLADYLRTNGPYRWTQKQINSDSASDKLVLCTRNQVANLIVNNETAHDIAAAALTLCRTELVKAAQAVDATMSASPCLEGSSNCIAVEKDLTERMLPALAARAMQLRAQGGHGVGRLDGTAPRGGL
jgi:hypothetical protein